MPRRPKRNQSSENDHFTTLLVVAAAAIAVVAFLTVGQKPAPEAKPDTVRNMMQVGHTAQASRQCENKTLDAAPLKLVEKNPVSATFQDKDGVKRIYQSGDPLHANLCGKRFHIGYVEFGAGDTVTTHIYHTIIEEK